MCQQTPFCFRKYGGGWDYLKRIVASSSKSTGVTMNKSGRGIRPIVNKSMKKNLFGGFLPIRLALKTKQKVVEKSVTFWAPPPPLPRTT